MAGNYAAKKEAYQISTDKSLLNIDMMHDYLSQESYWAKNIPRDIVEKAVENSMFWFVY